MLNNPINANDPSGHLCVGEPEGCLENDGTTGSGFTGTGGNSGGTGGGNTGEDNNQESEPKIPLSPKVYGPQQPTYDMSNINNNPSSKTLHFSNLFWDIKHASGGYVPVYLNGKLIGYKIARYSPDFSTTKIDVKSINLWKYAKMAIDNIVIGQLEKTVEFLGSKTMFAMASKLSGLSIGYDVASTVNDLVVFDGHIEFVGSLMIHPEKLGNIPDPNVYFGFPRP